MKQERFIAFVKFAADFETTNQSQLPLLHLFWLLS